LQRKSDSRTDRIHGLRGPNFATRYAMARGVTKGAQSQKKIPREVKFARGPSASTIFSSQAELLCAGAVFLVALVVYSLTLAPTVTPTDSGELILAAYGLGVAHPPGVPLWVMLAHLASLVPVGNVAVRINFSSGLFAALACAMLTLVVTELLITASCFAARRRRNKPARQGSNMECSNADGLSVFAPAVGAGLLMAFSRTLWVYATITEVYALNALLVLVVFFLVVRWRRRIIETRTNSSAAATTPDTCIYAAALVFGLAMGVHHVTVALTLPAIAVVVYRTEGLKFFTSRRLLYAALISIGALILVYSYLPWAASRSPAMNWGNPRSLQEIWWHITGRQYRVFFTFSSAAMGAQFIEFCRMALREFGFAWLPLTLFLAVAGLASAYKRDRTVFWFLLLILLADLAYSLSYEIAEDKDAYYLPAFISIAIAAGLGVRWLIQLAAAGHSSMWRPYAAAATAIVLAAVTAFATNWPFNNRRRYFIADDYVENLFSTIAPNGLLLTQDWQVASPMLYAQEIEQRRPDVKVVDINLLRRSWYFDYLTHAHPDLMQRAREKIDPYFELLKQWEQDPGAFARNQELTQRISMAFLDMIQSIVRNEIKVAPVYITNDVLVANQTNGYLTRWIPQSYQLVPQGLVFNLATDQTFHEAPDPHLQMRGLADGTVRYEKDDVINAKVLPAYTRMLTNRGRYLAAFNHHERAIVAFKQALALDPNLPEAQQGLAESTAKLRKP
jgi:transmembrane protein TMEM260 (protein O-mannosyltransferase)